LEKIITKKIKEKKTMQGNTIAIYSVSWKKSTAIIKVCQSWKKNTKPG
jgi:hypothetical protein